jgi:hypothetical protein
MSKSIRRNFAHLSAAERQAYIDAVLQADLRTYSDGVSYWDKQNQIQKGPTTTAATPSSRGTANPSVRIPAMVDHSVRTLATICHLVF